MTLPSQLRAGPVRVDCGIIDAAGRPVVKLAIRSVVYGGWHPLAYVNVQS